MHIFLKEAKRKQKWMTFAMIHRLTCQQNTLLRAPSILKHRFSRSLLIGTPVDFKRFEKRSVPTIDAKGKDSLDNDYPRNEGRLANRFFPINVLWTFLWDPTGIQNRPPPPKKKRENDFFSNWIGLFEICFRSSKMTDPRPCPTGWAYLEIYPVQRGHAKLNQQQIINCKNRYFLRVKETSQNKIPPPQTSIGRFLEEKLICLASSLNNIKAG